MLIRQVALLSRSKKVSNAELARVSAALQKQIMRDFAPIWNVQATVDAFQSEADVPAGYWKITVMDKIPAKGAAGFHLDAQGQPFADVLWSTSWSLTASHECLEMLADPFAHQIATGPSPKTGQGRVNFLVEICDPCEAPQFAYTMNTDTANEVAVSDFYTPNYFSPTQSASLRYSFRGNLTAPRQVLQGGYLSWQNPADGHIWQLFGPAAMGHFVDQGTGALNRENTDRHASKHRMKKVTPPPKAARGKLALTADGGGGCNLKPDLGAGTLVGTSGNTTTVQIQGQNGAAKFLAISYNGSPIGSNTSSASFTIAKGIAALDFTYDVSFPGDLVSLVDPCGTLLDQFVNVPSQLPTGQETVVGQ
jgi:hypothetical protein